jgi:hypothetical protein
LHGLTQARRPSRGGEIFSPARRTFSHRFRLAACTLVLHLTRCLVYGSATGTGVRQIQANLCGRTELCPNEPDGEADINLISPRGDAEVGSLGLGVALLATRSFCGGRVALF